MVVGLATRRREVAAEQLGGVDPAAWRAKRAELNRRQERRTDRRRSRHEPDASLRDLEDKLNQSRSQAEKKTPGGV